MWAAEQTKRTKRVYTFLFGRQIPDTPLGSPIQQQTLSFHLLSVSLCLVSLAVLSSSACSSLLVLNRELVFFSLILGWLYKVGVCVHFHGGVKQMLCSLFFPRFISFSIPFFFFPSIDCLPPCFLPPQTPPKQTQIILAAR